MPLFSGGHETNEHEGRHQKFFDVDAFFIEDPHDPVMIQLLISLGEFEETGALLEIIGQG